jgi:hypothetical protein
MGKTFTEAEDNTTNQAQASLRLSPYLFSIVTGGIVDYL